MHTCSLSFASQIRVVGSFGTFSDISRAADISLRIYLRTEAIAGQSGKNDPFMGSVTIEPDFNKLVRRLSDESGAYKLNTLIRLLLMNGTISSEALVKSKSASPIVLPL
jgi:hypothetical protein